MSEAGEAPSQFSALTGLRGIAATWVFIHHWNMFHYGSGKGVHALAVGYLAVDAFFLLSGFVMAHSRNTSFQHWDGKEYAYYLAERLIRLLPTNMVTLVLYAGAVMFVPSVISEHPAYVHSAFAFVTSFFLVQSWLPFPLGAWISPGWSVSVELGAYCVLPLVLIVLRRITSARTAVALSAACLVGFVAILILHGEHDPNISVKGGFIRVGCEFMAGAALYRAWLLGFRLPAFLVTVAAITCIALALLIRVPEAQFAALPGFALLVLLAAQRRGTIHTVLSQPFSMFLGRISFSLYLVHWPALVFWGHFGGFSLPLWANGVMVIATLALATVLHLLVESPSHQWARSLRRQAAYGVAVRREYQGVT